MTNRTRDLIWLLKMCTDRGATMGACQVKRPIGHTMSMARSKVLAMDVATVNLLMMDANLAVTQMVCCMDDIGCQIVGSVVVLDKCVAVAGVSVADQQSLDSASMTLIRALMRCVFEDVATNRPKLKIVCHNRPHRRQSNCRCMAFVRRLLVLPIVHERMPVTFDGHMMILKRSSPTVRTVCIRWDIFQLDVVLVLMSTQCRTDHDSHQAIRCHWHRAFSCDLRNSSMDSSKRPSAWHDVVTSMHWLPSDPLGMANQDHTVWKMAAPTMPSCPTIEMCSFSDMIPLTLWLLQLISMRCTMGSLVRNVMLHWSILLMWPRHGDLLLD